MHYNAFSFFTLAVCYALKICLLTVRADICHKVISVTPPLCHFILLSHPSSLYDIYK